MQEQLFVRLKILYMLPLPKLINVKPLGRRARCFGVVQNLSISSDLVQCMHVTQLKYLLYLSDGKRGMSKPSDG